MNLTITEIFYSIQGEGSATGYPFIFIRFSRCNLRCIYCDTGYSFDNGTEMTIDSILEKINEWKEVDKVLITGGEPLLQREGLIELIKKLKQINKKIYIETNGSLDISFLPVDIVKIVDIKTPSSGFPNSFLIDNIKYLRSTDDLKIVIGSREDFNFAIEQVKKYEITKKCTVMFSPVSGKIKGEDLCQWLLEAKLPIKLNLQIHKILNFK